MANCGMSLVEYDLDQPPPPDECLPGNADYVPAHLVLSPDEPIFIPEARMHLCMVKNFHKEWIFMTVSSHESREIDVSLSLRLRIEIARPPQM